MPFNGSGTFNRLYSWVQDAANGIKIRADRMDNEMNGMATGLSTCVTRDGQSPATANLPMGGFKHTNVADADDLANYPSLDQVIQQAYNFVTPGGTAAVITANSLFPISAYHNGQEMFFIAPNASVAGGTTINRDGVGAKTIQYRGAAITVGSWSANDLVYLKYDGTNFQLLSPVPAPDLTHLDASWITSGVLASARGGAGTVNGIMKADGAGLTSAAVSNTDYLPATNPTCSGTFTAPDAATWTAAGIKGLVGLGIGLTNPSYPIHVKTTNAAIKLESTNSSVIARFAVSGGAGEIGYIGDADSLVGSGGNAFSIRSSNQHLYVVSDTGYIIGGVYSGAFTEKWRFSSDGSLSIGTTTAAGAGGLRTSGPIIGGSTISAVGDITGNASDERLKERIELIENPFEKVMQLRGVTHYWNETAVALGKSPTERRASLITQDIKKVQPEAIRPAPISADYDTYLPEQILPLLVESIKQLIKDNQELRTSLDNLSRGARL